jgi:hypothetical protein
MSKELFVRCVGISAYATGGGWSYLGDTDSCSCILLFPRCDEYFLIVERYPPVACFFHGVSYASGAENSTNKQVGS